MSTLTFSDKYQPLFDLLTCWERFDELQRKKNRTKEDDEELFYLLQLKAVDTVCMSGGRDSGKSFALSSFNVIAVADYNHRILYTRQTMSSTDNSISEALIDRMELLGMESEFQSANNNYTLRDGRAGKITITGQKTSTGTQTAKLKSLEDYSIFETDEAEELVSFEDWKKIKRSLRAKDVQCLAILAFNPPTREHWIAKEFYEGVPDGFNGIIGNVLYIHTTYYDNGRENMAEHNWREYEQKRLQYELYLSTPIEERESLPYKVIADYEEYKYIILGGFKRQAEGCIYKNWSKGAFDNSLPSIYGLDFGSNDPDACVKVAVDESAKKIYVKEIIFENDLSTSQLSELLNIRVGKEEIIIADSAGKRTIRDLWDEGFEIERCRKGPDSVTNGIKTIKGYEIIVDIDSPNVEKALNNYAWSNKQGSIPNHDWSDLMDALRYPAMYILNPSGGGII